MKAEVRESENKIVFRLSSEVYELDAILGAAYLFLDRAYIYLDRDDEGNIIAAFKAKQPVEKEKLEGIVGEFHNELLSQTLRVRLARENQKIREQIVQLALYPGTAQEEITTTELDKQLDEILKEAEQADYEDDPLGIAVPWEEKYGEKRRKEGKEDLSGA